MKTNENGNALFLILIAVALFAALSYAITSSGRGGGTIDREKAMIGASQVTQFPAEVRVAIARMVITGTAPTSLDFTLPSSGGFNNSSETQVFAAAGGGVVYQEEAGSVFASGTATDWSFLDLSDATDGWYISGVGSDAQTSGREIIAALPSLDLTVCEQINKGLGLSATPASEGTPVNLTTVTAGADGSSDSAGTFFANHGQAFACENNTSTLPSCLPGFSCPPQASTHYTYYHALLEQ